MAWRDDRGRHDRGPAGPTLQGHPGCRAVLSGSQGRTAFNRRSGEPQLRRVPFGNGRRLPAPAPERRECIDISRRDLNRVADAAGHLSPQAEVAEQPSFFTLSKRKGLPHLSRRVMWLNQQRVGSTALSTRFDPEDLRELIGVYHHAVADTVGRRQPLGRFAQHHEHLFGPRTKGPVPPQPGRAEVNLVGTRSSGAGNTAQTQHQHWS